MAFSVVIPSRDAENFSRCLTAFRKRGFQMDRVVAVDDGVSWLDVPADACGSRGILTIPGVKPFNFSRNCNLGIRAAGDDDVILLNDDATLQTPGGFTALAECARQHPECGIISPVTDLTGNLNQFQNCGDKQRRWPEFRYEPRRLCFFCVYIPRATFVRLAEVDQHGEMGLLDERFPSFAGDDDFSWRCVKAGLKLGVTETCYVRHSELRSTFRGDPHNPSDLAESQRIFKEKWGFRAV